MELADPWLGLVALILGLGLMLHRRRNLARPTLSYSRTGLLRTALQGRRDISGLVLDGLMAGAVVMIALTLARPRTSQSVTEVLTPGVDIALVLDLSRSMLAEDMGESNRLVAAREVLKQFVAGREHDRLALVVFGAQAYTQCPLTLDYPLLQDLIGKLEIGVINGERTAIGLGLATAVGRLKDSEAKSRVIILCTDGNNNGGRVDPATATEMAKNLKMKVYTIGIGGRGPAKIPVMDQFTGQMAYATIEDDLKEEPLRKISSETGGRFYRATDLENLEDVFKEISSLEKSEIKTREYNLYEELYMFPLALAMLLLLAEQVAASTVFRRLP